MNSHQLRLMERKNAIVLAIREMRAELSAIQKQLDDFEARQKLVDTVARMEPEDKDEVIRQLRGQ